MTAFQKAVAPFHVPSHALTEAASVRDLAIQTSFAKLVIRRKRVPAVDAYAAYESSVRRENTFAALTGAHASEIVSFEEFLAIVEGLQHEIDAGIWYRIAANRRRLH
ncbi:hypothetical protein FZ934_20175 (plasmid) [Rhizobium grahamii]|uniref:Uncharacterized protein n=1 Tax=Rhizobium grahamii TaxID=1120045 RepID=A0A5Q0CFS4_9HYPH|nr:MULTISPECIES: hypothetical protein [Rhizobium]QFY62699.1 hypothetical protein FZ934_20175 [Rhizobium grahamii]QRM52557.1 hypothetical protein F3Y33_25485 [Rhizobium sp. BG6]